MQGDVYKRQVYYYYFVFQVISAGRQHIGNVDVLLYQMKKSLLQIAEDFSLLICLEAFCTVSYTHLDVYKRQDE